MTPDRYETLPPLVVAGLGARVTLAKREAVGELWARFGPRFGKIPGQVGAKAYGVSSTASNGEGFDYLAGVEVSDSSQLPPEFATARLDAPRYAVFAYRGDITGLQRFLDRIGSEWRPPSGEAIRQGPYLIERYAEDFDPATASGEIDVLIPLSR